MMIDNVNAALADHALVRYPDYVAAAAGERPFILATGASKVGLGAVLSQRDAKKVEQPGAHSIRVAVYVEA
jgi:hypothetical protein